MSKVIADDLFVTIHVIAIAGLIAMMFRTHLRQKFELRCVGTATAIDLAWIRILACGVLLIYMFTEDLGSLSQLDEKWYDWPGYLIHLKRGALRFFVESESNLKLLELLLRITLLFGLAGLGTRVVIPIACILYILYAALLRSFGKYFHDGYLVMYTLMVLSFLPCGDAWSVDARLRKWWYRRRGEEAPPKVAAYNWAVWAVWAALCLAYLQLATSKLAEGGPLWADGRSLRNYMITDDLNLTEWDFDFALKAIAIPTFLWTFAGIFAIVAEAIYPFVLISQRLRRFVPYCVAMLHLGVWFGQDALFVDAILMPFAFWQPSKRWNVIAKPEPVYEYAKTAPPVKRVFSWMRGPWIPIGIVVLVLVLDHVSYRVTFKYKWPIEGWQMYAGRMNRDRAVNYRRFTAGFPDGMVKQTGLGDCAAFLDKPYRLDFGLIRNMPRFLAICLPRIPGAISLSYETRTWYYGKRGYDEHLTDPPDYSFRVELVKQPPIELRAKQQVANLLQNGDFAELDPSTGNPMLWMVPPGTFSGFGLDLATNDHAFLLQGRVPSNLVLQPQAIRQTVELPRNGDRYVTASVLARTTAIGGQLAIEFDGSPPAIVSIPDDGEWHRIEATTQVPVVNTRATISLIADGETWFDDATAVLRIAEPRRGDRAPPGE